MRHGPEAGVRAQRHTFPFYKPEAGTRVLWCLGNYEANMDLQPVSLQSVALKSAGIGQVLQRARAHQQMLNKYNSTRYCTSMISTT